MSEKLSTSSSFRFFPVILLALIGMISLYGYYIWYPFHKEEFTQYPIYLLAFILLYGGFYFLRFWDKNSYIQEIQIRHILYIFLFQLIVGEILYLLISGQNIFLFPVIFIKTLGYIWITSFLWITLYLGGRTCMKYVNFFWYEGAFRFFSSLGLGFSLYMLGIFFLANFSLYNAVWVSVWTLIFFAFSIKEWKHIWKMLFFPLQSYNIKHQGRYNAMIDILLISLIGFFLSVNFLNVFRPYPIGWDDLGAYMNYPNLLAYAGEHLALWKMYTWELYTGIWFLFWNQTFAFFLNSFSGVLAVISCYIFLKIFWEKKEKSFDLALLFSLVLLMLPMSVFQLAKDMKLDYGLLTISIASVGLLYSILYSEEHFSHKKSLPALWLVGMLIWVTFSIKVTSLILLLSVLWLISYKKFSLLGLLWFILWAMGVLSILDVWSMMNIVIPPSAQNFLFPFWIVSIFAAIGCLIWEFFLQKHTITPFKNYVIEIGVLLLGFCMALLPWAIKNISEIPEGKNLSLNQIIGGFNAQFSPDYSLVYSPEEIDAIKAQQKTSLSEEGIASNADFWRYFGYETGINNYIKLPWNLTFQVNQKGEFTDISFLFLIFLPCIFLFLPFKKSLYKVLFAGCIGLAFLYWIPSPISVLLTNIFRVIDLPYGYIFIAMVYFFPLVFLSFTLDTSEKNIKPLLGLLTLWTLYTFLWAISSYGIVWYGIVMYVLSFAMIVFSLNIGSQQDEEIGYLWSQLTLFFVFCYFFASAFPHALTNLKNASFLEYKLWQITQQEAIFLGHPEYFPILVKTNMNLQGQQELLEIQKQSLLLLLQKYNVSVPEILASIGKVNELSSFHSLLLQLEKIDQYELSKEISWQRNNLYLHVLYPDENEKNTQAVYRVGTFMKYYISENYKRTWDDNLLFGFENYIYDPDIDLSIERLQKMWVSQILLDLNAATIDQDPRKELTQRYEHILALTSNPKVKLVETDSICLILGKRYYAETQDVSWYLKIAGVNYGDAAEKAEKYQACAAYIFSKIQANDTDKTISLYRDALTQNQIDMENLEAVISFIMSRINHGFKAFFEIESQ